MEMNYYPDYIAHYGIKGQKWGLRRFQNPDGTLTPEGKERYLSSPEKVTRLLNKADKIRAYNKAQLSRIESKRRSGKKIKPRHERQEKELQRSVKRNEKLISSVVKQAQKSGIKVDALPTMRNVTSGKTKALNALSISGGFLLASVMAAFVGFGYARMPIEREYALGIKYKAR